MSKVILNIVGLTLPPTHVETLQTMWNISITVVMSLLFAIEQSDLEWKKVIIHIKKWLLGGGFRDISWMQLKEKCSGTKCEKVECFN